MAQHQMTFDELIDRLLDEGIDISLSKTKPNNIVWYDLNTGMKSHLRIAQSKVHDEVFLFDSRYHDGSDTVSWNNVMHLAKSCLAGRDFMNSNWQALLIKEGLIETETVTRIIIK